MTKGTEETRAEALPDPKEAQDPALGPSGWVLLALSFAAAVLFSFGHDWLTPSRYGPGIGLTLSHWVLTAAALWAAKARKRLTPRPDGIFLLALSVLLSAAYAVFANATLRRLNLPVLWLVTAQALFSLTGMNRASALSGPGLWEGLQRYADSLFRHWLSPFASLAAKARGSRHARRNLLPGLLTALLASLVAAAILATADQVFSGILNSAAQRMAGLDGSFLLRLFMALLLTFPLFSHRFSLLQEARSTRPAVSRISDPTVFCLVLTGLSLVYALFGYVQIRYLFAGVESVRMSGGYAAYARSGFFQLVLVALLTLGVILPALTLFRENRAVRALCGLTALLTVLIDVSAFVRMRLYIEAYGLSTLRVVTLWGIGVILLALLAVMGKALRPAWRICPVLAAVILSSWVALNWINVDRVVADSQVARFNAQAGSAGGVEALASDQYWSPAYAAAFGKIAVPAAREEALRLLDSRAREERPDGGMLKDPPLYDWSLAFLRGAGDSK